MKFTQIAQYIHYATEQKQYINMDINQTCYMDINQSLKNNNSLHLDQRNGLSMCI